MQSLNYKDGLMARCHCKCIMFVGLFTCLLFLSCFIQNWNFGVRHPVVLSYNYYVNKQSTQLNGDHVMQQVWPFKRSKPVALSDVYLVVLAVYSHNNRNWNVC